MAYIASSEPPPHPPSWDFSKVAAKGGWKIFTRNREVVVLCGDGKFLRSLYIVGRGVLTPLFYEDPLYCQPPSFLQFCPTSTSNVLSFLLSLWLNGWSCHIWCAILLNGSTHVKPWYPSTRKTLMCFMEQGMKFTVLTHNMDLHWYSDLISHENPKLHTAH